MIATRHGALAPVILIIMASVAHAQPYPGGMAPISVEGEPPQAWQGWVLRDSYAQLRKLDIYVPDVNDEVRTRASFDGDRKITTITVELPIGANFFRPESSPVTRATLDGARAILKKLADQSLDCTSPFRFYSDYLGRLIVVMDPSAHVASIGGKPGPGLESVAKLVDQVKAVLAAKGEKGLDAERSFAVKAVEKLTGRELSTAERASLDGFVSRRWTVQTALEKLDIPATPAQLRGIARALDGKPGGFDPPKASSSEDATLTGDIFRDFTRLKFVVPASSKPTEVEVRAVRGTCLVQVIQTRVDSGSKRDAGDEAVER